MSKLFQLDDQVDITTIARQGSGSACRSLYGGFVRWCSGTQSDGSDSLAVQLKPASSWNNLHILILVVSKIYLRIINGSHSKNMKCIN